MKKIFLTLNIILLAALLGCTYVYMEITGKLVMKGVTAGCFVALGSVLFFFSDVMLVLSWFAGAGRWADVWCLCTYFPGQGLLAHAVYHHVQEKA